MSRLRTLWFVVSVFLVVELQHAQAQLTQEEELRLVMKADASVIDEKLKEMPYGVLMAPAPLDTHSLPVPTMDPPLPEVPKPSVKITTASGVGNKGALSERIRNAMKTMKERMRTLQSSRPRLPKKPIDSPKAPKFPRPSSLVTSNPSDLEVAMKRIEIMASRAGFNMSSIPRRSQLQIVSRLAPKLPSKMASAVQEEMDSMSGKLYAFLPEPARDPLIEDDQAFLQHFMDQFDSPHTEQDEFYKQVNSHVSMPSQETSYNFHHDENQKRLNSFDVSQVSLTDDMAHEPITSLSESISSSTSLGGDSSAPNVHLMPPKFDAGEGDNLGTYSVVDDEGVPLPSALISQYPTHHVEESDPLITLSSEVNTKSATATTDSNGGIRSTKSFQVGSIQKSYGVTAPPPPKRLPPTIPTIETTTTTKETTSRQNSIEDFTVSVPPKPIRVSVITKDSILVNDTQEDGSEGSVRTIKYVHVEPIHSTASTAKEELSAFDKYLASESIAKEVRINPKEISVQIDKESLPSARPSVLTLDTYQQPEEPEIVPVSSAEPPTPTEDPYPLTDEEIAATVAELKKYEAEIQGIRQGENSLEVDYPYRLLTPHPLEYPDHPDHPQPSSLEDDSDLVSHLDELLAEFNQNSSRPTEGSKAQMASTQVQVTMLPSPSSPPMMIAHGHRRPHPLHKQHRHPLARPGLGRPMMMGSRLRPMLHRPPVGFPRPAMPAPPKINEVTVSQLPQRFNKECDYFSDELCLLVQDYPIEAITEAMDQNPSVSTALLSKEPIHNQKSSSYMDGLPDSPDSTEGDSGKHPDFAGEGGFLCPSKVAYGKIKKAKSSTSGDWKFIVNYADKSQTLRLEKCLSPGDSCSYIMPHFRTACTQVYNYHRLLAWDSEKGLHMDVFKVPTCCTCHVLGYYVPGSKKSLPQSPAMPSMRRRDHMGPRFMGPPRPRRISPHHHHHRKPLHPMMVMLPGGPHQQQQMSMLNGISPVIQASPSTSATLPANTSAAVNTNANANTNSEDEVLRSLLLQYASLREKITKLKDTKASPSPTAASATLVAASSPTAKRSSKMYSNWPKDIIKALRKRKRQSTISLKNNKMKKPSPQMLKKLKNLLANSTKLENNPKLKAKIQTYLRKLKNASTSSSSSRNSRGGRNMKLKLSNTPTDASKKASKKGSVSKADAKKRLMSLLSAAKNKMKEEKKGVKSGVSNQHPTSPSTSNRLSFAAGQQHHQYNQQQPRNRQMASALRPHHHHQAHPVNHESHPIWDFFHRLQGGRGGGSGSPPPPSRRARRLRLG
ncbi:unnamed protein product [Orchesella dallaii]|uniref:Spaetzle domain-containing protein n=1 Tax=Orchesella dallaii TaxID=48710 RepID=A0ABP1S3S0_9HEXA